MSAFQKWLLRRIVRFCCLQGCQSARMRTFFCVVIDETNACFYEDNLPTTQSFLSDRMNDAYKVELRRRSCV